MRMRAMKLTVCAISTGRFKPMSAIPRRVIIANPPLLGLLEYEADHNRDHQAVDRDRLGEGDAEDHVGLNNANRFGVAPQRLHRLSDQVANADTSAKRPDTDRDG